jgi:hypothetical protein
MTPLSPARSFIPFRSFVLPAQAAVRWSCWPFQTRQREDIGAVAEKVIAITARHWRVLQ